MSPITCPIHEISRCWKRSSFQQMHSPFFFFSSRRRCRHCTCLCLLAAFVVSSMISKGIFLPQQSALSRDFASSAAAALGKEERCPNIFMMFCFPCLKIRSDFYSKLAPKMSLNVGMPLSFSVMCVKEQEVVQEQEQELEQELRQERMRSASDLRPRINLFGAAEVANFWPVRTSCATALLESCVAIVWALGGRINSVCVCVCVFLVRMCVPYIHIQTLCCL